MQYLILIISLVLIYNNWNEINRREYIIPSFFIGLTGGIINAVSMSYLYNSEVSIIKALFSGLTMAATLAVGLFLARKAELPLLWSEFKTSKRWILLSMGIIGGVLLGFINLKLTMNWLETTNTVPTFFQQLNSASNPMLLSVLLSIQAGIVEEIIFRIFFIPAAYLIIKALLSKINKMMILTFSVLISAFAFGLIPAHNLFLGMLFGIFLGFSYLCLGLLPMIAMHTVGNLFFLPLIIKFIESSNLL